MKRDNFIIKHNDDVAEMYSAKTGKLLYVFPQGEHTVKAILYAMYVHKIGKYLTSKLYGSRFNRKVQNIK